MILIQVDEGKIENLRTLIEWALCRQEHVGHHVLLTACKDEIYIRQKLDVGAQQGLCAIFGIFGYLLELIDSNIDSFLRLFQILEDNVLYLFHILCYIFYEMQRYDFLCNYHHSFLIIFKTFIFRVSTFS